MEIFTLNELKKRELYCPDYDDHYQRYHNHPDYEPLTLEGTRGTHIMKVVEF